MCIYNNSVYIIIKNIKKSIYLDFEMWMPMNQDLRDPQ